MIRSQGIEVLLTDLFFPPGKLLRTELLGNQGLPVLGFTTLNLKVLHAYSHIHTHTQVAHNHQPSQDS